MIKAKFNDHLWHALSVGLAVLTAVIVNSYTHFDQQGWLVLTAFLCMQTTRGTPLRQGLIVCVTIVLAMLLACFLLFLQWPILTYLVVALAFIISACLVFLGKSVTNFVFVLAIAVFAPENDQTAMSDYLLSIGLGALIGIAFNQFFFSIRLDKAFFEGVAPLLKALNQYSLVLANNLIKVETDAVLAEYKLRVEKSLLFKYGMYPNWVYETGFNPGLRSGWRYFLIHLERATDIYFSLDFFARRHTDVTPLAELIHTTLQKNAELLEVLIQYVEGSTYIKIQSDFTSDLTALEEALRRIVPNQIELLDVSPDYIALTTLVTDMRDLRGVLLQLVMSLPNVQQTTKRYTNPFS